MVWLQILKILPVTLWLCYFSHNSNFVFCLGFIKEEDPTDTEHLAALCPLEVSLNQRIFIFLLYILLIYLH